jgi:regulator of sigma E protease
LPIPVLDGGHLLLLLIETVRRKPLTLKQKAIFQQVGLAILLALMVMVFYNDIFNNLMG